MYDDFSPLEEPVTPEFVLDVLRDMHRQQAQFDPETDPAAKLSFATTVAEWREAYDLLPWRELAGAYNGWWNIQCTLDEWQAVLEPERQRTLADVCGLIARHAKFAKARPAVVLGYPCLSAGTFLTVRSLLRKAGANVDQMAPSTPLAPFTRRYLGVFLGPISWLSPGSLPDVKIHHPIYHASIIVTVLSLLATLVGSWVLWPWVTIVGVVVTLLSYAMTWIAARSIGPSRVEFGQLRTFRDLATAIASQARI